MVSTFWGYSTSSGRATRGASNHTDHVHWSGLPGTTFSDWISLLIVALLIARTPGVPAKDLLFLSLALALGDSVDADQTQVTAMFLADTALRQLALVPSLIAAALWRSRPHPIPLDRLDEDSALPERVNPEKDEPSQEG